MSNTTVGSVVGDLLDRFPEAWAEEWDRVGLLAGDPSWEVTRVLVSLDADPEAVDRAVTKGFDLIVTHHPPFLEAVSDLTPGTGGRAAAWRAVTSGVAIASFHTNLDRSPEGATALPRALGFDGGEPLEAGAQDVVLVTVYVPAESASDVRAAMARAGGGRVGGYEACSFTGAGTGRFVAPAHGAPHSGRAGQASEEHEERLEMLCEVGDRQGVLDAAVRAHPYEEPVVTATDVRLSRGGGRFGRVCDCAVPMRLVDLAARAAEGLGAGPRVWGEADGEVSRIAFLNGSASSLLPAAISSGADALVCGEVRYHAAQEAAAAGLAIIEAGHDASEWPLVGVLADAVRDATRDGGTEVVEASFDPRWWMWGGQ